MESCSLFPLIANLPHYLAVKSRQDRKESWVKSRALAKAKHVQKDQKEKNLAAQDGKAFKSTKFDYPSFQDTEVKNGFAVTEEVDGFSKKDGDIKRTVYRWRGIDFEEVSSTYITFDFCVAKLYKKIVDARITAVSYTHLDVYKRQIIVFLVTKVFPYHTY